MLFLSPEARSGGGGCCGGCGCASPKVKFRHEPFQGKVLSCGWLLLLGLVLLRLLSVGRHAVEFLGVEEERAVLQLFLVDDVLCSDGWLFEKGQLLRQDLLEAAVLLLLLEVLLGLLFSLDVMGWEGQEVCGSEEGGSGWPLVTTRALIVADNKCGVLLVCLVVVGGVIVIAAVVIIGMLSGVACLDFAGHRRRQRATEFPLALVAEFGGLRNDKLR